MKAEQLSEHAPAGLAGQESCLSWTEPELVRQPSAKLFGRQQDRGR
jgi:hypothetical protein